MYHKGRLLLCSLIISIQFGAVAQQRIDGQFPFQSDPAKAYSIYVPAGYEEGVPHRLMLGFHPLNTSRWDAEAWCDTLIVFAETNDLLLVCPDGGADGAVDDPIDTAFTTALLDSIYQWYDVDREKVYVMGFSWGGKTAYTYGLERPEVFHGFLPIGAAITNLNEVNATLQANSSGKPVYIVHGSQDSPTTRYTPVLNALTSSGAVMNSILMAGVGHTIDFPNRNAILGTAFQWIDSVNCANIITRVAPIRTPEKSFSLAPSVVEQGSTVRLFPNAKMEGSVHLIIRDVKGLVHVDRSFTVAHGQRSLELPVSSFPAGTYMVQVEGVERSVERFVIF